MSINMVYVIAPTVRMCVHVPSNAPLYRGKTVRGELVIRNYVLPSARRARITGKQD